MSHLRKPVELILMVLIGAVTLIPVDSFNLRELSYWNEASTDLPRYDDYPQETDSSTGTVAPTERMLNSTSTKIPRKALTLEELSSLAMLDDTNATIQAMQLYMYRQKTQLALKFLNRVIPFLESIQKNMTDLYSTSVDPSSSYQSFAAYKEADDALENKLTQAEGQISGNRHHIQRYVVAYRNVEQQLRGIHQTLGNILLPELTGTPKTGTPVPPPLISRGPNVMTGCGGALNYSDSGSIAYKYRTGETLSGNEGCVWTVFTEQHTAGISFTLRAVQFQQNDENFISVGYFRNVAYNDPSSLIWQTFTPSTTPQTLVIPSPVAFVHFVSSSPSLRRGVTLGASSNSGFHLDFQTNYRDSNRGVTYHPNRSSSTEQYHFNNIFLTGPIGSRRYPLSGEYKHNERTAIVVQPTSPRSALIINNWSTEDRHDTLAIYTFGSDFQWTLQDTLSGDSHGSSKLYSNQNRVPRNDPYILIFRSDGNNTRSGFEFGWASST